MPDATTICPTDALGIPVDLRDVEAELARLWGPAALELGVPKPECPNVTRVVLANLVLECLDADIDTLSPVLATVMAQFPCLAIVLCGSTDPAKVTAEISTRFATCRHRASRRCAPNRSSFARSEAPSIFFPAPCGRCSRPICRTSSGGLETPERVQTSFTTSPASALE